MQGKQFKIGGLDRHARFPSTWEIAKHQPVNPNRCSFGFMNNDTYEWLVFLGPPKWCFFLIWSPF